MLIIALPKDMKSYIAALLCAFSYTLVLNAAQAEDNCGQTVVCTINGSDGGTYYVASPTADKASKPLKAFIFFHGHNGSGCVDYAQ